MYFKFNIIGGKWCVSSFSAPDYKPVQDGSEEEKAVFGKFIVSQKLKAGLIT